MDENKSKSTLPHNLVLENRKKLTVSSVDEVDSFDEQNIVAFTSYGELTISGNGLHIIRFSTDTGDLAVEGDINAVSYSDNTKVSGGFFSRIFR